MIQKQRTDIYEKLYSWDDVTFNLFLSKCKSCVDFQDTFKLFFQKSRTIIKLSPAGMCCCTGPYQSWATRGIFQELLIQLILSLQIYSLFLSLKLNTKTRLLDQYLEKEVYLGNDQDKESQAQLQTYLIMSLATQQRDILVFDMESK